MMSATRGGAYADDPRTMLSSLPDHVTDSYPPSFISTGPADPLLRHSQLLADRLSAAGVTVDTLFFDPASTPESVGHEYALALPTEQGREAMVRLVAFLRAHAEGPELPGASAGW